MTPHPAFLRIALPALLAVSLSAQAPQKPESPKSETQTRAEAFMERARHLSDIRAPDAPAFRLKATFSFVGDNLDTTEGTYTETWVSDSQWRRETVIGNLRHVEVGGADKRWLVYPEDFPVQANKLPVMMSFLPPASLEIAFAFIRERATPDVTAECAFSKPVIASSQFVFCFEKKSGVLLEKVSPERRPRNVVSFSCEYGGFRKFGDYSFPREVACFEDQHKKISASIVELSIRPPIDPTLFERPAGAIELGHCSGKTVPPTLSGSAAAPPGLDLDNVAWIDVWFVVDTKGKPQDLRLLRSANKESHEKAQDTVRGWHFKPGACDGKPMPMPLTIRIPYTPR